MIMGKLIVLEGTDGCGKSTQMSLLSERMKKDGRPFRHLRFPQYEKESSALIRLYLGGAFGMQPSDVNPYAASLFYAVDRFASFAQDWKAYYEDGGVLIADRYTTSNAVHQGGKLPPEEQRAFFSWLYELEFEKVRLPEPDLVICLDMPIELSEQLMRKRESATNTTADIHEQHPEYLAQCRKAAAEAAAFYGWKTVSCAANGALRTPEDIHGEIYGLVTACLEGE